MEQKEIFKKSLEASKKFVNSLTKEQLCDLMKVFDDYETEQCNMHVVGVTLPSYDETNAEIVDGLGLIKTLKDSPFKNATTDEAYTTGFANCYNWLNKKLGN